MRKALGWFLLVLGWLLIVALLLGIPGLLTRAPMPQAAIACAVQIAPAFAAYFLLVKPGRRFADREKTSRFER